MRSAIVNALTQCYSDVTSPSLNTAAFAAALNAAYAGGILDIQTVTQISAMTNQNIIYRYNGTQAGYQKGLYYYSPISSSWVLIGSEVHSVSNSSQMTDTNSIYKYTGTQSGMVQNSLYCHNGTSWVPIGSGILTASTAAQMTNVDAIYKYTGTEAGYVQNALYYYNGTDWAIVTNNAEVKELSDTVYGYENSDGYIRDDNFRSVASSVFEGKAAKPVVNNSIDLVNALSANVYYFDVTDITSVTFPKGNSSEALGNAFIDESGVVLERFVYTGATSREYTTVSVPSGAKYFVLTWWNVWVTDYNLGIYLEPGSGEHVAGLVDRVSALENAERGFLSLDDVPQVPTSTVNAMLKCAYTYIDACKNGSLSYSDGTGSSQAHGTICCSTFCRQLLQGIPYNDYKTQSASGTTESGQRFRYGYQMIGTDYYANDSTATAQKMYDTFAEIGRAYPTTNAMTGARPGDMIVFGTDVTTIRHIGLFVFRDINGVAYIMDSTPRNGDVAIKVHAWDSYYTPVGIIRPSLTEANVTLDEITASVNGTTWTADLIGYYLNLVKMDYSVTANSAVTLDSHNTFTPTKSGKDYREIVVLPSTDGEVSQTATNVNNLSVKISNYI